MAQELGRLRAARLDLTHVRDVEYACVSSDCDVLLAHSLVLHRHLPAGEVDHSRIGAKVAVVEGRALQIGGGSRHANSICTFGAPGFSG